MQTANAQEVISIHRARLLFGIRSASRAYRRIHTGIKGTPMQGFGGVGGAKGSLSSDEIWHLVHFVRNLQYEPTSVTGKTKMATNERLRN